MKIYMIRHCESLDDVLDCYGGCADFELTEKGVNTARAAADKLPGLGIEKIFASPYRRAKHTARIFADIIAPKGGTEIINDLREYIQYGAMCGVNKTLAKEIYGLLLEMDEYNPYGYYKGKSFYGGEPVGELDARAKRALDYIVNQGP